MNLFKALISDFWVDFFLQMNSVVLAKLPNNNVSGVSLVIGVVSTMMYSKLLRKKSIRVINLSLLNASVGFSILHPEEIRLKY